MQFKEEPEGWDDHIVKNPPIDPTPDPRDEYQSGLILGVIVVISCVGLVAGSLLIAYAVFM